MELHFKIENLEFQAIPLSATPLCGRGPRVRGLIGVFITIINFISMLWFYIQIWFSFDY